MSELDVRAAEILEKAADLLVTQGWTKKVLVDSDGRRCAIAALRAAEGSYDRRTVAVRALADEIVSDNFNLGKFRLGNVIITYNDTVAKEVGDVTDKMLTAAKKLRGRA